MNFHVRADSNFMTIVVRPVFDNFNYLENHTLSLKLGDSLTFYTSLR